MARKLKHLACDCSSRTVSIAFTDDPSANGGSAWTSPADITLGRVASFDGTAWTVSSARASGWPLDAIPRHLFDFSTCDQFAMNFFCHTRRVHFLTICAVQVRVKLRLGWRRAGSARLPGERRLRHLAPQCTKCDPSRRYHRGSSRSVHVCNSDATSRCGQHTSDRDPTILRPAWGSRASTVRFPEAQLLFTLYDIWWTLAR